MEQQLEQGIGSPLQKLKDAVKFWQEFLMGKDHAGYNTGEEGSYGITIVIEPLSTPSCYTI